MFDRKNLGLYILSGDYIIVAGKFDIIRIWSFNDYKITENISAAELQRIKTFPKYPQKMRVEYSRR